MDVAVLFLEIMNSVCSQFPPPPPSPPLQEFLPEELSSCIITTYKFPNDPNFKFSEFYERLNQKDLVIYPGKVTRGDCFRIGTIGELYPEDVEELLAAIKAVSKDMGVKLKEA